MCRFNGEYTMMIKVSMSETVVESIAIYAYQCIYK